MADNVESRIDLNIDVSNALASIKTLQAQISAFHQSIRNSGNAVNQAVSDNLTKNLLNSINATQKFSASLTTVNDSAQSFTNSLERNKLSMGQYFKFAGGASKNFSRLFTNEFNTIEKVARERVKTIQTQYIRMGRDANGALEAIKVRPLRLDMEQLGTQVAMTAQKQQLFNQLVKQGSTNLLNFGKNTQWAGRQLMVGFTIPLSIMGTMAIKEFEKIEKQAIRFKRVYGDAFSTDAETDAALANIRKLATEFTKYGVEVEKTMELAADAAQMGLKGADLNAQVAEATRLAVLGEVEQQEALKATIAVTNTFGIAAEDLAEKINFLNAVENETLTAISDLTIAIPKAGPVVKQLGGSVEDLAFFLTAMKEGGINASEGANALKSALSKVINPTEKASEMLAGFGININSIVEGNAGDIKNTILELGAAFDRLDPLSRSRAIEQLFGTFQFARISTLFNNISKEGGQAAKVLELTKASAAQLAILSERELKRVEDSPIFKFEKAIERLQESLAPLGAEFIKIITPLIEFGTKILKSFNEMDEGAKAFVTNIVTVLGLIAPVAIMTFGLIANGIANFIKGVSFVGSLLGKVAGAGTGLNQMTQYMTQEQLEATAAASALGQAHSMLTTTFTAERAALDGLVGSYNNAITAINRYNVASQSRSRPGETPATRGYARGVLSVPGPKGAGDVIPAMLSPGEAVIPAKEAEQYRGFISQMISGNIPGFAKGVMLGMPRSGKAVAKDRENAQAIFENFKKSKYANVPPTEYGHQLAKTSGHSFPLFGVGGVYLAPSGKKVFVKPVLDETAAMAEMRGTQIARQAHGLKAPQQRIVVMRDPYDTKRQRKFLALESDLDATFVNNDSKAVFNEEQYFRQLVASLVRVDKDLAAGNMFGDVVADVGPAGVFSRASGARDYTADLPSMEQQAMVNLLGVKGGAKRAFAESTVGLMAGLSPQQYQQKMITEIQRVLPALRQTVAGFGLTDQREIDAYTGMIKRLEQGLTVDWTKFHAIHSGVKVTAPKPRQTDTPIRGYADGVVSVPGPKGKGDVIPAMLSPGEAVIPAKKAKRYNALIRAMIAGKVPGFVLGTNGVGLPEDYASDAGNPARRRASIGKSFEKLSDAGFGAQAQDAVGELKSFGASVVQARKMMSHLVEASKQGPEAVASWVSALKQQAKTAKSGTELMESVKKQTGVGVSSVTKNFTHIGGGAKYVDELGKERVVKSELGMSDFDSRVNAQMAKKGGASATDFLDAYDTAGVEKWNHSVAKGGGNLEELSVDIDIFNQKLKDIIRTSGATRVFDLESDAKAFGPGAVSVQSAMSQARQELQGNKAVAALDVAATIPREVREGGAIARIPKDLDTTRASEELRLAYDKEMLNVGKSLVLGIKQGADDEGKMASPSREMYERGKNLVRGILNGVADGYRESTGKPLPTSGGPSLPPPPGFENKAPAPRTPSDADKGRAFGKNIFSKVERAAEKALLEGPLGRTKMGGALKETFIANALSDANVANGGQGAILTDSQGNVIAESKNLTTRRAIIEQEKLAQATNQAQLTQEQALQSEERINLYNEDGTLKTRKQLLDEEKMLEDRKASNLAEEKRTLRQKRAQDRQARAGRALGVLGTASMVAGMASGVEGRVGEIAQKVMPALFGLSAIAPILMALPGPLALLAVAVGGIAFGVYKWNEMLSKSRESGIKLANALSMSTDKLVAFSEATGTVSATEERRSEQESQLSSATGKQRKFGQEFLASEFGTQFMESVNASISSGMDQAPYQIANQIASAVAQGILTPSQANSIVASIGAELGDFVLSGKISAQLISLIGPNGQDLTREPLDVVLKIQESGMGFLSSMQEQLPQIRESITSTINEGVENAEQEFMDKNFFEKARDVFVEGFNAANRNVQAELEIASKTAEVEAALVQLGINKVQENQQLLDSLDRQYDIKLQTLEEELASTKDAQEKLKIESKINDTLSQRKSDFVALNRANSDAFDQIVSMQQELDPKVFSDALKATIDARYGENEAMAVVAKGILDQITNLEDSEFKTTLQLQLASGDLSPTAASRLLEMKDTTLPVHFNITASAMGIANATQLLQLMMRGGATDEQLTAEFRIAANIEDPEEFDRRMEAVNQLSQVPTEYGLNVSMTGANISAVMDAIEMLDGEPERITYNRILELEEANPGEFQGIIDNWNTLTGGADSITKEIIFDFKSVGTGGNDLIRNYLQATGAGNVVGDLTKLSTDQYSKVLSAAVSYFVGGGKNEIKVDDDEGEGDGGGGDKADPFANILSQLKLVRNAAINAGGGLKELLRILGDSAKEMQTFRGVSQKLLAEGFSREFIDSVMSMDEETRKTFIGIKGGVITVTEAGRALAKAFDETALGNYQNTLAETAIGINSQVTAMTKLTAAEVPLSTATEMVQDKTLALAIASAATTEEILALKNAFDAVTEAEKNFASATPEGRQKTLDSVISEANAYFAAQETMYNQQYEAALKAYEDANDITEAQRDLADREFELDDLQFALNSIADQESKINEQYDKRQEAIENIFKANKAIIDQDKERLDIAGALASGDLAAAAKAMRAQTVANLERNKESQLENLQRSREMEISQVRDDSGKSRLELEEAILGIEKEIADIQEKKLEPYQREIDLLGRIRDDGIKDTQAEGFLGKTQAAWAAIANEVDRAKFNVEGYQTALRDQLAGIPGITIGEGGAISVDADQLMTPEVAPEPTQTSLEGSLAEVNPNQAEIDELNRLRQISRKKFKESKDEEYKKRLFEMNMRRGERIKELGGTPMAMGGIVKYLRMGGMLPYKADGGSIFKPRGTDTVPAMLTPGEFVVRRRAVTNFGLDKLNAINTGTYSGESVYNYSVNVNVKSDANPDEIARSVMTQIKRIDSQRIRSNNY